MKIIKQAALIMEMETLIVIKKRCIFIVESVSGSISESLNFLIAISQLGGESVSQSVTQRVSQSRLVNLLVSGWPGCQSVTQKIIVAVYQLKSESTE